MTTGVPAGPPPAQSPQWGAPPPKRSRPWWPWVLVIGVLVVAGVAYAVIALTAKSDDDSAQPPASSSASGVVPSTAPATPGAPVPCGETRLGSSLCLPEVNLSTVQQAMEAIPSDAKKCGPDSILGKGLECTFGDNVKVSFYVSDNDSSKITRFNVLTSSGGKGAFPEGEQNVIKYMKQALERILPPLFPSGPDVVTQVKAWSDEHTPTCTPSDKVMIGGYEITCGKPAAIGVQGDSGPVSSWTTDISVNAGRIRN